MTLQPGVHSDVDISAYIADPAISKSDLHRFEQSPSAWLKARQNPPPDKQTAATIMGTAVDCAITEPDEFPLRYVAVDPFEIVPKAKKPRATNAWKQYAATIEASGKTLLTLDEYRQCIALRDAVMGHPEARKRIDAASRQSQLTLVWERGVPLGHGDQTYLCRSRPDILTAEFGVTNLKTARTAEWDKFVWQARDLGYFFDTWWAIDAVSTSDLCVTSEYEWLVVDKATLEVAVYKASDAMVEYSRGLCEKVWPKLVEALDHGTCEPRYPKAITKDPPHYAANENEDEEPWAKEIVS